ncbi:MAG: class I SAM-dependent methyltransferase [Bryobacteraceae bacterium]
MIQTLLKTVDTQVVELGDERLPRTIATETRRVYDVVAGVYPLSTFFFHSKAHEAALEMSGIQNGMRVLEVAVGSGEMFRKLVAANPRGETVGVDLSPNMAARTHRLVRQRFPGVRSHCHAVDARYLPFREGAFDAVVCCYLLELLSLDDIAATLSEVHRVLRHKGTFTLVLIGQNAEFFNNLYKVAGSVLPAFWGRQVDVRVPLWMRETGFRVRAERTVKQSGYPSRVLTAVK